MRRFCWSARCRPQTFGGSFRLARRACASLVASGLVLGLATTTAGAAPAQAAPAPASPVAAVATESLDPTFVQEGMPSPHGGQVVDVGRRTWAYQLAWTRFRSGVCRRSQHLLVPTRRSAGAAQRRAGRLALRRLGRHAHHLTAPPQGTTYTADSSAQVGIGSSGPTVSWSARAGNVDSPDTYGGGLHRRIRRTSRCVPTESSTLFDAGASCAAARRPAGGLRYTADQLRRGPRRAGRRCAPTAPSSTARRSGVDVVRQPTTGTRFVGVDMGLRRDARRHGGRSDRGGSLARSRQRCRRDARSSRSPRWVPGRAQPSWTTGRSSAGA